VNSLVVVGVGSPFGDDALGLDVIDALRRRRFFKPGWVIELVKADRPGVQLLELLRERDAAVLIDAMSSGAEPGTVRLLARSELARYCPNYSSHDWGIAQVLALGDKLQVLPTKLDLVGVELGSELTEALLTRIVRLFVRD
jgi:hydrogenase maturation protease